MGEQPGKVLDDPHYREVSPGLRGFYDQAFQHKVPLNLQIQLTDRCNLRCEFCYNSLEHKFNELSYEEIVDLLHQAREIGTHYVCLTGGEPTLHPDFFKIARKVRELGFALEMITNGTLLTEEHYALFKELKTHYIAVSLHGLNQSSHERLTHTADSFRKTKAAIERMIELGLPVELRVPITRYNFHELDELIFYAEALGINYRFDCNITYREDGDPTGAIPRLEASDIGDVYKKKWQLWLASNPGKTISSSLDEIDQGNLCSAGHTMCYIDSVGRVHPCPSYQHPAGSLREESFRSIWEESPFFNSLRSMTHGKLKGCEGCGDKAFCTFCPGDARLEGVDKDKGWGRYERACKNAKLNRDAYQRIVEA